MSKGAYKYSEMSGSKCMPKGHMPQKSGTHRMSAEHGLNSGDATKGLRNVEGRVGAGVKGFEKGSYRLAGPVDGGGAGHSKQSKGHGKQPKL